MTDQKHMPSMWVRIAYLKCQEEEVHVPLRPRYAVLVDDCHTNGSQTIRSNGDCRIVGDLGDGDG